MAAAEEDKIGTITSMIDVDYEFSAPRFFDFTVGETEEEMREAELWFGTRCSYAPSPFMPRIKTSRSVQLDTVCDFSEDEQLEKASTLPESSTFNNPQEPTLKMEEQTMLKAEEVIMKPEVKVDVPEVHEDPLTSPISSSVQVKAEVCTPTPPPAKSEGLLPLQQTNSKKQQTAKKIANLLRDPSALKSKYQPQQSQTKGIKTPSIRREAYKKITAETPNLAQENQAIKRQKLEGGKSRQILNVKPQILPHKNKAGLVSGCSKLCSSTTKTRKEDRKLYVRETAAPFVSMAELMRKFQSNTREMSLSSHVNNSISHDEATGIERKPKLTLTRPKEPEFETAQRVRSVKIKSSAELEEEMMAKIPKFKARPLNKKILETPTLPTLSRKNIPLTEFKEFHLETMSRANQNAETSKVVLVESSQSHQWKPNHLTAPKSPVLQTSLRARPPTSVKSSDELEKEELEKIPKFKARPLNKRIFESKGDLGIFCNKKRQITVPQEFHFAIDERIPPPTNVADMFDKLSIRSEPQREKPIPRNTTPQPFQLHTEERGMEKVRKWTNEVLQKEWEEECARIPKAHPYPYTTDYPVVPPKPEPKPCTKPEPFELESLMRHEEEVEREMEERRLKELGEAQMRVFKAQPILKEDPISLPEKPRIPLTEVQEFNLQVQNRAIDRAEFDKKVKEKEMMYKRYREEAESAKLMEEEKALKQLRRTLVPHARPVPNFNRPFMPRKSSKHVTKPMSPRMNVEQIKERRKMSACPYAGQSSSSSATKMR